MKTAEKMSAPIAIRYPRGKAKGENSDENAIPLAIGKGRQIHASDSPKVAILTIDPSGFEALKQPRNLKP